MSVIHVDCRLCMFQMWFPTKCHLLSCDVRVDIPIVGCCISWLLPANGMAGCNHLMAIACQWYGRLQSLFIYLQSHGLEDGDSEVNMNFFFVIHIFMDCQKGLFKQNPIPI